MYTSQNLKSTDECPDLKNNFQIKDCEIAELSDKNSDSEEDNAHVCNSSNEEEELDRDIRYVNEMKSK